MAKKRPPGKKGRRGPHPPIAKPSRCPICGLMIPDPPGLLVHLYDKYPDA